jgi:type VI secretion system protein ImpI
MALHLKIEAEANLPADFVRSASVGNAGPFVIGRDDPADWKLPDPLCQISSRHCEILREEGGDFVLNDRSTNGTFLNGATQRLDGPHRLLDGDRITIGTYVISFFVALPEPGHESAVEPDVWGRGPIGSVSPVPEASAAVPASRPPPNRGGDPAAMVAASGAPAPARSNGAERAASSRGVGAYPAMTVIRPAPKPVPIAGPVGAAAPPLPGQTDIPRMEQTTADAIRRRAAKGLGLPVEALERHDADALVEELGVLVRLAVGELKTLLDDRAQAMRQMCSKQLTAIDALNNNPLKFSPTTDHALALLFGARNKSYLDTHPAIEAGFADVRTHQRKLMASLLGAMQQLARDLDPKGVEGQVSTGLNLMSASRKARLWNQYVANWQRYADPSPGQLSARLLRELGDAYDEST